MKISVAHVLCMPKCKNGNDVRTNNTLIMVFEIMNVKYGIFGTYVLIWAIFVCRSMIKIEYIVISK